MHTWIFVYLHDSHNYVLVPRKMSMYSYKYIDTVYTTAYQLRSQSNKVYILGQLCVLHASV